jgi:hypothetical protein
VVIRDGVYTSDTPEEQDGEWQWLRFTAAASPGNSGGPLVDRQGRLIGLVLRKSPSENLNYALPIRRVLDAKPEGRLSVRMPIRFPVLDISETFSMDERFTLPLLPAEFYKISTNVAMKDVDRGVQQLMEHNAGRLFPNGSGAERLLHLVQLQVFPALMREGQNGTWALTGNKPQNVPLDHDGFVEITANMVRLRAPDDVSPSSLQSDSTRFMDLMLKALPLRRIVGSDQVRVTSLGKATQEESRTDAYGRTWLVRS